MQIKHLDTIFTLLKFPNLKVVATALRVLADIFVNIAPLQPIDVEKVNERAETKITKQEYKVVNFERILVAQYQRYIELLKELNTKTRPQNFKNDA